jgi:hypothetical protein
VSPAGERPAQLVLARPFHIGVGSLAAGLALSPAPPAAALATAAAVAAMLLLVARGMGSLAFLAASLVLAGAAVGDARIRAIDASASRIRDGPVRELPVFVASLPRVSALGSSAEIEVAAGPRRGARLLLRVPRWARLPPAVEIGRELVVSGRLRELRSEAGAGFDFV